MIVLPIRPEDIPPRRVPDENRWLDVEDAYRDAGWDVLYVAPGIGDNYKTYYRFTKKEKAK